MPLSPGDPAPPIQLPDATTGELVVEGWADGPTALAFFKVTCPVCQMVAPCIQALADGGARVVAVGQDPPDRLLAYAEHYGQRVRTLSDSPPYAVSDAYRISAVPTLFVVGRGGVVEHAVGAWDRIGWNEVAAAVGVPTLSVEGDGLPAYRPG